MRRHRIKPIEDVVDAFTKSGPHVNKYVETKGWLGANGGTGKQKWEWFHGCHPTSELRTKDVLARNGALNG